jgi:group I intron endonuclease
MKKCGIYKIINTVTGQFYLGSSVEYDTRIQNHIRSLKRNDHFNPLLQRAWNKYGPEAFIFELIEECEVDKVKDLEGSYLQKVVGLDNCYNISKDPLSPTRGIKRSSIVIEAIANSNRGQKRSEEQREANRLAQLKKNEERKKLGLPHPNKGRKHTDEFKKKCRDKQLGKQLTEKAKETLLKYAKLPKSEEHRKKISESEKNTKKNNKLK